MTTKSKKAKAPKALAVTAPKIENAYRHVTEVANKSEAEIAKAIHELHLAIKGSKLSTADIEKSLKQNTTEGTILKFSHVEGLANWAELSAKYKEFKALPIAKQLSLATASYKLLGAGAVSTYSSLEKIQDATKEARKVKNSKGKAPKEPKAPKGNKEIFSSFLTYISGLNPESVTTKEAEILQEISVRICDFEMVTN